MQISSISTLKKYFLFCITYCTFFSCIGMRAEVNDYQLERPKNYLEAIAKQYLNSFIKEEVKEQKTEAERRIELEKRRKRKEYEIDRPALPERERMSILLLEIFGRDNKAAQEFLQERLANDAVNMLPIAWETMHILLGSPNAPDKHILGACLRPGALDIEKTAMALLLVTPTASIEALGKYQASTAVLLENPALYTRFKELYGQLQEGLPAVIALYSKELDPMWSIPYQKGLQKLYTNKDGRFISSFLIDWNQFGHTYMMVIILIINVVMDVFATFVLWQNFKTTNNLPIFIGAMLYMWGFFAVFVYGFLKLYFMDKAYNDYISGRIADVKTLLEVARELSNIISSYPILEALYGDKLKHTRKLLALQHENPVYNETVKVILNNEFKSRNLFTSRISKVLCTMTLLEENIRMLDEVLFELGHLGVFLSIARLVENPDKNRNTFSFAKYFSEEEKPDIYIDFKRNWSLAVDPNKAVPNHIFMNGASHNTAAIMGPNACGKSIIFIRAVFESALLAQTLGIIPGTGAFTPFSVIYVFKEPKDDPSIKKSLFARELDIIKQHKKILQYYQKLNKKTLTIYDEFLNSTNPLEGGALQCVLIVDIMQAFPKNANFISTHNPYLIEVLRELDKGIIYHVKIKRYPDNTYKPLYKIAVGTTTERVGIDLYEKETGDAKLAEKARKLAKLIEESQGKVNYTDQAAATV